MSESQQGPEICDVISRKPYLITNVLEILKVNKGFHPFLNDQS